MSDRKHAYLIFAHKCDYTFQSLIEMLDYPLNDIFIHMDAKYEKFSEEMLPKCVFSKVYLTQRIKVAWGGASMIDAELLLLKEACKHGIYEYYHLLSGEDLPIKTNNYIHAFFKKQKGKEFVDFQSDVFMFYERVKYYYFFQEKAGRNFNFWRYLDIALINVQRILKINRNNNIIFQKGANWFSITDELARYIIAKEDWISNTFSYTRCCDELVVQSIIQQSDYYRSKLFYKNYDDNATAIMRLIDWKRGQPYIFRESDYDELILSDRLWARKFNCDIDKNIIDMLKEHLNTQNV